MASESQNRRIYVRTLGCPKNEVDSDVLITRLQSEGYTIVDSPELADCEIVSTCGFIEPTKDQSIDAIFEAVSRSKETNGDQRRRVLVTGCLAQRYGDALFTEIPEIDAVVGFNRPDQVLRALKRLDSKKDQDRVCWVEPPGAVYDDHEPSRSKPREVFAYIKISDGCNNACSFCAIPRIRGRLRTRPMSSIVDEARWLVSNGVKELILVSQDTSSYGLDVDDGNTSLPNLLRTLNALEGDFWIRTMYVHPAFMSREMITAIAELDKVIKYIDMPLQHATDKMLSLMNRHINRSRTQDLIDRMRSEIPGLTLRTTFIVGHPGETDEDFEELAEFADENNFERQGAFVYSHEECTGAYGMSHTVELEVARERADRLAFAFDERAQIRSEELVGKTIRVLLEHPADDMPGYWEGRPDFDAPEIDGRVLVEGHAGMSVGFTEAEVTDAAGVDLTARAVGHDYPGGSRRTLAVGRP